MRYSRAQYENSKTSQQKGSRSFLFFAILAVVIVGVYLIGVAKVGDFLSQKIVTPVVSWLTGEDVKAPSESQNAGVAPVISPAASNTQKEMKLPGGTIFALHHSAADRHYWYIMNKSTRRKQPSILCFVFFSETESFLP